MKFKKNKTKKKRKKNKKKYIKKNIRQESIKKCLNKHKLIYLVLLVSFFVLNKRFNTSLITALVTFILVSLTGYLAHIISHTLNFTKIFYKTKIIFKKNKNYNLICLKICKFLDFHRRTHHNSKINKKWKNIFYEAINNSFFQGIALVLFIKMVAKINNIMTNWMIIFWLLLYVTVHNINYNLKPSWTHIIHHKKPFTNISFGFDFYDIIFGTANSTEYRPDIIINILLITIFLYYTIPYFE